VAGRASFRHLYFSFDKRSQGARQAAEGALPRLADPFMFQDFYGDRSPEQVANVFGAKFTRALFRLAPGTWQGPIESGFGWHLVWVESMTPAREPTFEEVEPEVRSAWVADLRAEFKRQTFEAMRARYDVVLPGAPANATAGNGTLPVKGAP
jgi:hypothetical protein